MVRLSTRTSFSHRLVLDFDMFILNLTDGYNRINGNTSEMISVKMR